MQRGKTVRKKLFNTTEDEEEDSFSNLSRDLEPLFGFLSLALHLLLK